jgi:glycosyltransferase involved in cell wall biosynthesis
MRVLLISQHFPPDSYGGVEAYVERVAGELTRAGHAVTILVRRLMLAGPEDLSASREELPVGIVLYRIFGGGFTSDRFLVHHEKLEQIFMMVLAAANPDVVHFNHLRSLSPRFIDMARRMGLPVVVSLHDFYFACAQVHLQKRSGQLCAGPDWGRECARCCFPGDNGAGPLRWGLRALYFRRLLQSAQRVVAGSRYVASFFERFSSKPGEVCVIPNGVDVEPVNSDSSPSTTPAERGMLRLAYCGTVLPLKGPHVILDALQKADLPAVDLLLLGATPATAYLEQLQQSAANIPGLTLRVHGSFRKTHFPSLLSQVDCAVVPTVVPEAGPQVPREILARGIPVLASHLGALPEIVEENVNGFVFDPSRPEALAAILKRVTYEDGLLKRLREAARQTHVVTVREHVQTLQRVYQEAIADPVRRAPIPEEQAAEVDFLHDALVDLGFSALE